MFRPPRARVVAWSIVGLTVACIPLTSIVISQPHRGPLSIENELSSPFAWVGVLAFSIVGVLIVSRHPRHLVGWIFSVSGLSAGVSAVTTAYAQLGQAVPGAMPGVHITSSATVPAALARASSRDLIEHPESIGQRLMCCRTLYP